MHNNIRLNDEGMHNTTRLIDDGMQNAVVFMMMTCTLQGLLMKTWSAQELLGQPSAAEHHSFQNHPKPLTSSATLHTKPQTLPNP
jgi:hypothetical protein